MEIRKASNAQLHELARLNKKLRMPAVEPLGEAHARQMIAHRKRIAWELHNRKNPRKDEF